MLSSSLKTSLAAVLAVFLVAVPLASQAAAPKASPAATAPPQAALPPASIEDRVSCGIVLISLAEIIKMYPNVTKSMGESRQEQAMVSAMLMALGTSAGESLNAAMDEASAKGRKPDEVYRASLASMAGNFTGIKSPDDPKLKDLGKDLFMRCITATAPAS